MAASLLKDPQFVELCQVLKIPPNQLVPSDPDKKQIERAFRKCALKTHPDKVKLFSFGHRKVLFTILREEIRSSSGGSTRPTTD